MRKEKKSLGARGAKFDPTQKIPPWLFIKQFSPRPYLSLLQSGSAGLFSLTLC
jgi:hypothetical protein